MYVRGEVKVFQPDDVSWAAYPYTDELVFGTGSFRIQFQRFAELVTFRDALDNRVRAIIASRAEGASRHRDEFYGR